MNILVCIKAVPSTNTVKLDPVTHTIIRDGKQAVVNPFDLAAAEEALCIKERLGGTVTVLSMGIPADIVMKWTGHSDYAAMKPYIDIAQSEKSKAMDKFNKR